MLKDEMNSFKEEVLKNIRELERKLIENISIKQAELNDNYERNNEKISRVLNSSKEIIEKVVIEKINHEKLNALENFKNKADSMLITHEIRINKYNKELDSIKTKYDRIIADNLLVPGYIGISCQYKNIGEYIIANINEFSRFKFEKDTIKQETKEMKTKVDGFFTKFINLVDNSIEKCKIYTDEKFLQFKKFFDLKLEEFREKSLQIRIELGQAKKDIENQVNELILENEKITHINEKFKKLEDNVDKINKKMNKIYDKNFMKLKIDTRNNFSDSKSKKVKNKTRKDFGSSTNINEIQISEKFNKKNIREKRKSQIFSNNNPFSNLINNNSIKKSSSKKNNITEKNKISVKSEKRKSMNITDKDLKMKEIKLFQTDNQETKEERKNDEKTIRNIFVIKNNKEDMINKNNDNNNINENFINKEENNNMQEKIDNAIIEKEEESKSEINSKSKRTYDKKENTSSNENNNEKDVMENFLLKNIIDNKNYLNNDEIKNKQKTNTINNNNVEFNLKTKIFKKTLNNEKKIDNNILPIIANNKKIERNNIKVNSYKSIQNTKKNVLNNSISQNSNSNNNSINQIKSNITSKKDSAKSSYKTSKPNSFNQSSESKNNINNVLFKNNKKSRKKLDTPKMANASSENNSNIHSNNQNPTISPTTIPFGLNYVGLNIDNNKKDDDDDSDDDIRFSLSGKRLNELRLQSIGFSPVNSQKIPNKKIKLQGISTEAPLKISAAFGRTAYTFIDKNNEANKVYSIKKVKVKNNHEKDKLDLVFAPFHK